ncbi:hypothetical protein [Kitasatospora sp. NPDC097643]|uniref:hypothetical protein n=1 Tax=Kitasatospora sp. NPDC097643 TaxID=3157230 RepID=UPI0033270A45
MSSVIPADLTLPPASTVRDVDPTAAPPEIRTRAGETVFVSSVHREELEAYCREHRMPVRARYDVWGDLLEPFVDTEFTPARQAATLSRLGRAGLGEARVSDIRAQVGPLMRAYNGLHWDWCGLGLADLLDAAHADWIPEELRVPPAGQPAFRAWAMGIAELGAELDRDAR